MCEREVPATVCVHAEESRLHSRNQPVAQLAQHWLHARPGKETPLTAAGGREATSWVLPGTCLKLTVHLRSSDENDCLITVLVTPVEFSPRAPSSSAPACSRSASPRAKIANHHIPLIATLASETITNSQFHLFSRSFVPETPPGTVGVFRSRCLLPSRIVSFLLGRREVFQALRKK